MESVFLNGAGWSYGPVLRARGFVQRWRGLRQGRAGGSLLLRTRSVHGFGMKYPFLAVGLTRDWRVSESRLVSPGRLAYFPRCRWVLELPADAEPPPSGLVLEVTDA
ncbi:MAG: hypothetical protein ACE5F5_08050 [Acidimicrobiia bacterium]